VSYNAIVLRFYRNSIACSSRAGNRVAIESQYNVISSSICPFKMASEISTIISISILPIQWHAAYPEKIIGSFGIHPWYSHTCTPQTLLHLKSSLEANPQFILGEIGLDRTKSKVKCSYETQRDVFIQQLDIAAQLKRPVSIHCVRDFGNMFDILRVRSPEKLPPTIALHSFGKLQPEIVLEIIGILSLQEGISHFYLPC
jgi:Tat protein secretion system quality control protein TatD with DNase activity